LIRGGEMEGSRLGVTFAITRNVGPVSHGIVGLFRSASQPFINRRIQVFGKLIRRSLQIGDNLDATLLRLFVLKPPWLRPGSVLRVFGNDTWNIVRRRSALNPRVERAILREPKAREIVVGMEETQRNSSGTLVDFSGQSSPNRLL
jgi:hypothetical protein